MKLSTRGEYGLRAMLYLAQAQRAAEVAPSGDSDEHGALCQASEISRQQDIPGHYLKQILSRLRAAGFIRSTRGPQGGHTLAMPAADISVADIIQCLEGTLTGVENVLNMPCEISVGPSRCVLKEFLLEMKTRVERLLEATTLDDLARRQAELCAAPEPLALVRPAFLNPPGGSVRQDGGEPAPLARSSPPEGPGA